MAALFDQTNKVYVLLCEPGGQFIIDRRRVCRDVRFRRSKRTLLSSCISSRIVRGFGITPERRTERRFEESNKSSLLEEVENCDRPPFDINLAVVLAGFAFEAYNTPSEKSGAHETDPFDCKTTILSEQFLRELYDGQLSILLKKGFRFPGLDLWGTSDPYVTLRVGEAVVRSKTIWATTEPFWNENFRINVKNPAGQYLQVAAWDANLVTDDRRLGNAGVKLDPLLDGEKHKVELELEGMNGGGVVEIEVQYQTFDKLDADSKGWKLPSISDFLAGKGFEDVLKGFEGLKARDFLSSALGPSQQRSDNKRTEADYGLTETHMQPTSDGNLQKNEAEDERYGITHSNDSDISSEAKSLEMADQRESDLLRKLSESVCHTFGVSVDKLGVRSLNRVSWDAIDLMKRLGLERQKTAEPDYIENGLAIVDNKQGDNGPDNGDSPAKSIPLTLDVQKASLDLLKQTEDILRSWAVIAGSAARQNGKKEISSKTAVIKESLPSAPETERVAPTMKLEEKLQSAEEMEELRKMFSKAESAMEAWALLATSLGQKSFVKSAFEKICFLDNNKTDTQVAIWRDSQHHRLVVAFRGTEQVKWKDLRTDLMLLPVGFNPERIGGDFKEEPMVHGGFLSAYDSVRHRLMTLVKASVGSSTDEAGADCKWHVYVTGHSLGGALATLFALQLTETQLYRDSRIKVTMYNFGSPRVGNRKFAHCYNARVKDSWRVVNHRDIIPTVPRLMGYCHVAQPIYLTAGDMYGATVNMELLEDGYQGDVIGEATPDFLLEEFMKGEKQLIERLFQTEIAMLHALRDGSALMQHMEDFYYIALLENVSPRFRKLTNTDDKTFKT